MRNAFFLAIGACAAVGGCTWSRAATEPNQTLLIPFVDSSAEENAWIAPAVQSSLLADLPHAVMGKTNDVPSAETAHGADARYIVTGHVQRIDTSVRLTAELFDASGHEIGSAKESGELHDLFILEDKLAFDLRDSMRTAEQSRRAKTPMPVIASAGPLKVASQPLLPVGTVPVSYSNRTFREGNQRNIYNTPFYEYDGFGYGGCGLGGLGLGAFGGFGFGGSTVGFYSGGTGQGAY